MLNKVIFIVSLMATVTAQADISLSEVKKNLNEQEYKQYTHELWQKDRKKAKVTDYSEQFYNKQGGNTLTVGPNVQCAFPTIQLAINFAIPGDTIFVADDLIIGTNAKLNIDKELTLVGGLDSTCQVFTANRTYLQLDDFGPVINIDVSGGKNVILSGFDISGAEHSALEDYDGGLVIAGDGSVTITNSHIHDNASFFGGGITVRNGTELILKENTEIYNNTAISNGGGIFCSDSEVKAHDVLIGRFNNGVSQGNVVTGTDNSGGGIYSNTCTVFLGITNSGNGAVEVSYNKSDSGAGIFAYNSGISFTFEGSQIKFNSASTLTTSQGVAIHAQGNSSVQVHDLQVTDNDSGSLFRATDTADLSITSTCNNPPCSIIARNKGVFAWIVQDATGLIQNSIIKENTESSGVLTNQNGVLDIENCIISDYNTPSNGFFSAAALSIINFTNVSIANNNLSNATSMLRTIGPNSEINFTGGIIWGNTISNLVDDGGSGITVNHSIIQYDATDLTNTIQADPLFNNPDDGDYHITYDSPARDHFNSSLNNDFEGDSRPQGLLDDAGADEWTDLIFAHGFELD